MQLDTRKPPLYVEDHNQITVWLAQKLCLGTFIQVQTEDLRTDLYQNPQRIEFNVAKKSYAFLCVTTSQQMGPGLGFLSSFNKTNIDTCTCL